VEVWGWGEENKDQAKNLSAKGKKGEEVYRLKGLGLISLNLEGVEEQVIFSY